MTEANFTDAVNQQTTEEQLQLFITNLNILKNNMAIYPPGHLAIKRSGELLPTMLKDIFSHTSTIVINVIKNSLLVNEKLIETNNTHVKNFALFISRLGIASITIVRGLHSEELIRFCELLLKVPVKHQINQHSDILHDINSLANIRVKLIDLSSLRFSSEDGVDITQANAPLTIWQKFILYNLSPDQHGVQDTVLQQSINQYSKDFRQDSLDSFVSAFNITEERLVQSYLTTIKDFIQTDPNKTEDLSAKKIFMQTIHKASYGLTPEYKEKVLSATFDTMNSIINEESSEELISCIPGDMIADIFTQAVLDKKTISPILIKLISDMYRAGKQSTNISDKQDLSEHPDWDSLKELFSKESHEKYLPKEYAEQLRNLSMDLSGENAGPDTFISENFVKSFHDNIVNMHLASALLLLMQGNIDDQLYSDFADNIAQLIPDILDSGGYRDLYTIYRILKKYSEEHVNVRPAATSALELSLNTFTDNSFSSRLEEAFKSQDSGGQPELDKLIIINGANNLPWLIDYYLKPNKVEKISQTLNLLCQFGSKASNYALGKLPGSNQRHAIALLKLIQRCKGNVDVLQIRKILKSKDIEVRLEAIKTLLAVNDTYAEPALWKIICSKDNDDFCSALNIIYEYKVHFIAYKLASHIKTFIITETTLMRNKAILGLLGSLGSENTLPVLRKKAGVKFSLTPANLRKTREYLLKTLAGYPESKIYGKNPF